MSEARRQAPTSLVAASIAERVVALLDASCTLVELVEGGSMQCWLQIDPVRTDQELLPLMPGAPIVLASPRTLQRLHVSAATAAAHGGVRGGAEGRAASRHEPTRREVNASHSRSVRWTIERHASSPGGRASTTFGIWEGSLAVASEAALRVGGALCLCDASRTSALGVREAYLCGDSDGRRVHEMLPLGSGRRRSRLRPRGGRAARRRRAAPPAASTTSPPTATSTRPRLRRTRRTPTARSLAHARLASSPASSRTRAVCGSSERRGWRSLRAWGARCLAQARSAPACTTTSSTSPHKST